MWRKNETNSHNPTNANERRHDMRTGASRTHKQAKLDVTQRNETPQHLPLKFSSDRFVDGRKALAVATPRRVELEQPCIAVFGHSSVGAAQHQHGRVSHRHTRQRQC